MNAGIAFKRRTVIQEDIGTLQSQIKNALTLVDDVLGGIGKIFIDLLSRNVVGEKSWHGLHSLTVKIHCLLL